MAIAELNIRQGTEQNKKLTKRYTEFGSLLIAMRKKEIPEVIIHAINQKIVEINSFSGPEKELHNLLRKSQLSILTLLEKELKLVPKNLFTQRWMAIGMASLGIPIGAAFGVSMHNMSFLAIGIPIGMVIGMAIGSRMDKKAFEEGRQLEWETKL